MNNGRGDLLKSERKEYIDAVLCLSTKLSITPLAEFPGVRSRYDDFVATHINQTMTIHATVCYFSVSSAYYVLTLTLVILLAMASILRLDIRESTPRRMWIQRLSTSKNSFVMRPNMEERLKPSTSTGTGQNTPPPLLHHQSSIVPTPASAATVLPPTQQTPH